MVELMMAVVAGLIVILAVGVMLTDGQRGFNQMYNRTMDSDVLTDSTLARRTFDRVVRKSSYKNFKENFEGQFVSGQASSFIVGYYYNSNATDVDSWAEFSFSGSSLTVNYTGAFGIGSVPLANNVTAGKFFHETGTSSISMIMTITDPTTNENMVVTTTAFLHNDNYNDNDND